MKTTLFVLLTVVLIAYYFHGIARPQHGHVFNGSPIEGESSSQISIRQNDGPLCGTAFYDDLYALTVSIFSVGAENVTVKDYQQQVFALIRTADEFEGMAEEFVEHVEDIPRQLVDIIIEDPKVLDSCNNFSVALVGPP